MVTVLALLTAGTLLGIVLRRSSVADRVIPALTNLSIYVLLFLLGVSVASNETVLRNLGSLGFPATVLALAGILGSCAVARMTQRWIIRDE